jgi:uncharacterized membrane-anchored protein YjiN (DUF445 family)
MATMTPDPALRMKIAAGAALVAMAALFASTHVWGEDAGVWGYVRAFAEAGLIGGLADWFAVTALFRRPLGLPIPHTAVIPKNQQRIADAVGRFVAENFLDPRLIEARLAEADPGRRVGEMLADPSQARALSAGLMRAAPDLIALIDDDAVARFWREQIGRQASGARVGPAMGSILEALTAGGKHQILIDAAVREGFLLLEANEDRLRRAVREQSGALLRFTRMDKRVSDAVIAAVEELLHETANDPGHPLRVRITEAAREFAAGLREDEALQARVERIMADTLTHPAVADFAEQGWREAKTALLADAERGEDSEAGRALADALTALGRAILTEDESRAAFNARLTPLIIHLAERHGTDVARLISETVASWDAATVVDKIEAGVGRDLQYIRLNGTLIGGLIGVALHAMVTMS